MIQEKSGRDTGVSDLWEERFIQGFISKQEAETLLLQAPEPMMLIRFSDNQLAGLSIVCLSNFFISYPRHFPLKSPVFRSIYKRNRSLETVQIQGRDRKTDASSHDRQLPRSQGYQHHFPGQASGKARRKSSSQ